MEFTYVNNSVTTEPSKDMSADEQMFRISFYIETIEEICLRQEDKDFRHPSLIAKNGFKHASYLGNAWNFLSVDDEHKQIFIEKLKALKIKGKPITKVENAKLGDREDLRIYWNLN